jgi:hypothetical protein
VKQPNPTLAAFRLQLWQVPRDCLALGFTGAVATGVFAGIAQASAFLIACGWLALNFTALALLLLAVSGEKRPGRLFILFLACVKLPASYLLLFWLYACGVFPVIWLTAGICSLPVVLVIRGIYWARAGQDKPSEEG